jgi:N4-gp56 family major capsid protein
MSRTVVGLNDAKAVKKYSAFLAVDTPRKSYWGRKFTGSEGSSVPVVKLDRLKNDAGEYISFDINMQLKMKPVEGDDILENKEEKLIFYTDGLYIDQMRGGVDAGGRMTRKRTIHDLRKIARKRQSEWWARVFDELHFMYASGARGINDEFVFESTYTGFANNSISAPDSLHHYFANKKTKATLTVDDKMTLTLVDQVAAVADMMGGGNQEVPQIQPIKLGGEDHFVLVMNPWQAHDLRTSTSSGQWLDIQKAIATNEGSKSMICKGGLGIHNNVVLQKHKGCIRFSDYGAANPPVVEAARALFMGEQALAIAYGSPGTGLRFDWHEETRDNGNILVISTYATFGLKKVTFNGLDHGVIALDTAAKNPMS